MRIKFGLNSNFRSNWIPTRSHRRTTQIPLTPRLWGPGPQPVGWRMRKFFEWIDHNHNMVILNFKPFYRFTSVKFQKMSMRTHWSHCLSRLALSSTCVRVNLCWDFTFLVPSGIMMDPVNGKSRGYGFLIYTDKTHAQEAAKKVLFGGTFFSGFILHSFHFVLSHFWRWFLNPFRCNTPIL